MPRRPLRKGGWLRIDILRRLRARCFGVRMGSLEGGKAPCEVRAPICAICELQSTASTQIFRFSGHFTSLLWRSAPPAPNHAPYESETV